ncbi:MAG: sodium ion-translocating decarboxylase subunit beta [Ruminococcaceae bacterium]|nr:sodium ion-translocating decarboxylase subunit beta [Oscillospiraceae bacterium]
MDSIINFLKTTGIAQLFEGGDTVRIVQYIAMYVIIGILFYLALVKKFEPLLLVSIAFGMLLANLPGANVFHMDFFISPENPSSEFLKMCLDAGIDDPSHLTLVDSVKLAFNNGGLVDYLYLGVKTGLYPSLIFLGVGAMTDFTALIANPKSLLMGAAAQLGVFVAFLGAIALGALDQFGLDVGFDLLEAAAIGIIGGADGPTAILVTKELAPHLLGAIAIAAYSYMALIPIIQPPFMRMLTTESERKIEMTTLRPVSQIEKVLFPIVVTFIVCLIVPDATPLVGFLMLGNLFTVCGVTDRLSKTAQNELINIVTIMLGVSVGATANAEDFLSPKTIFIIILGLVAFSISTCGGLLFGKLMCFLTKGKINPLIGSAGVSAVPMAARVAQMEGQKANPKNFLLMHAMGPNVAGVIGSAVAAGVLLSCFG